MTLRIRKVKKAVTIVFLVVGFVVVIILAPVAQQYLHTSSIQQQQRTVRSTGRTNATIQASSTSSPSLIIQERQYTSNKPTRERITEHFDKLYASQQYKKEDIGWIQEYALWHDEVRRNYYGREDNNAIWANSTIKISITYQYTTKGGLADRFYDLGHLLYKCHQERRLFFLTWHHKAPKQLEEFMIPSFINWTLPPLPPLGTHSNSGQWSSPETLKEALIGTNDNGRIKLRENQHPSLGSYMKPYSVIWGVLFRPSLQVQQLLDQTLSDHNLIPFRYDVIHLRLAHPAFFNRASYSKQGDAMDKHGLMFFDADARKEDSIRAINAASNAIDCAQWLATNTEASSVPASTKTSEAKNTFYPLFVYADSQDLIRTVVDPSSYERHYSRVEDNLATATTTRKVTSAERVALSHLNNTKTRYPNRIEGQTKLRQYAHIASRDAQDASAYYSSFVDLYIGSQARCITVGVGRFAYLAFQISEQNQDCITRSHFKVKNEVSKKWGMMGTAKKVSKCPVETIKM